MNYPKFSNDIIVNGRIKVISKEIIEQEKKYLSKYIDVTSASKLIGCNEGTIRDYIRENRVNDVINYYDRKYRISLNDFKYLKEKITNEKKIIEDRKNIDAMERVLIELNALIPSNWKNFKQYSKEYLIYINKFNSEDTKRIRAVCNAIKTLINLMTCDITEVTDFERINILSSDIKFSHLENISRFLNFVIDTHKNEIKYRERSKAYRERKNKSENDEIYSLGEFHVLITYLVNIDTHIEKAITNRSYANKWLYSLLHLTVAWRSKDIFLKIPNLDLDLISIYDFDWFHNNDYEFSIAITIIQYLEEMLKIETASKNKKQLFTVIATPLVIPISIVYIICEIHRRNEGNNRIFPVKSNFQGRSIDAFFKNIKDFKFSSKKCNKTLMSYQFAAIWKEGIDTYMAYSLSSLLRSHTRNYNKESEISHIYLNDDVTQDIANKISHNLFYRGHFGYLYKSLIELKNDNKNLKFEDMTQKIVQIKGYISPLEIETISSVARYRYENINNVLEEYRIKDTKDIKKLINNIINGNMPSKTINVQCLLGKDCHYNKREHCFGCEYSLVTIFALKALFNILERNLNIIESDSDNIIYRVKHSKIIMDMMGILNDLYIDLNDYGYKGDFITGDQKRVLSKFKEMYSKGLLQLKLE